MRSCYASLVLRPWRSLVFLPVVLACGREPTVTASTPTAPRTTPAAEDAGPPASQASARPPRAPVPPPSTSSAPPAPAVTAIACPSGGGDALALALEYEGKSSVKATGCRSFELAKVGLEEVPGDPKKDHFELFAADGRLLFTGIWSDPFVPVEGPIDDQGHMGWTTGELRFPQTWELIVPNRPEAKRLELWAVARAGATPVLKARVTLR